MNNRILGQVFFAVTLIIVVYLALNLVVRPKRDYVLRFRPADVVALSLKSERGDITLHRIPNSSGEWGIGKNAADLRPADARTAEVLLAFLARMEYIEKFDLKDLSQGGEDTPLKLGDAAVVRLRLRSDDEIELKMGRETPSGTEYYVASSQKPDLVYTVQNRYYTFLLRSDIDLATRQLIPISSQVATIELEIGGTVITLSKSGEGWRADTPKISPEQATGLVQMVRKMSFANYFEEQKEEDLSKYGLTVPDLEITIVKGDGAKSRYSISFYGQQYFLHSQETSGVFIVVPNTIVPLFKFLHKVVF